MCQQGNAQRRGSKKCYIAVENPKKALAFLIFFCIIVNRYGSMVKRLRLRPLTAATRVRIPIESPDIVQLGLASKLRFFMT